MQLSVSTSDGKGEDAPFDLMKLEEIVEVLDHLRMPVNGEDRAIRSGTVPYYGANGQQGWIDKALTDEPLILLAEDGGNFDDFATRPIAYRIDGPAWVNNHAHIIRSKPGVVQSFVFWNLVHRDIRRYIAGGTRTKLTQGELRRIQVLVPRKAEQQTIAKILDTLDTAIRQTEAIIEKLKQVKQGLLHDLLTRGIDANGELRPPQSEAPHLYKESPLGWIPKEWEVRAIETLLDGIIDYRGKTPAKTDVGVPLITAKNVRVGYIDPEPREYLAESTYSTWMTRGFPKRGDVLFTTEAPMGNVAEIETEDRMAFAQRVIILQPKQSVPSAYLKYLLMSAPFQRRLIQVASGTTALGVKQSTFRRLEVAVTQDERERIEVAKRLQSVEIEIDVGKVQLQKLGETKVGLMDDLLTGRVRVTALLKQ